MEYCDSRVHASSEGGCLNGKCINGSCICLDGWTSIGEGRFSSDIQCDIYKLVIQVMWYLSGILWVLVLVVGLCKIKALFSCGAPAKYFWMASLGAIVHWIDRIRNPDATLGDGVLLSVSYAQLHGCVFYGCILIADTLFDTVAENQLELRASGEAVLKYFKIHGILRASAIVTLGISCILPIIPLLAPFAQPYCILSLFVVVPVAILVYALVGLRFVKSSEAKLPSSFKSRELMVLLGNQQRILSRLKYSTTFTAAFIVLLFVIVSTDQSLRQKMVYLFAGFWVDGALISLSIICKFSPERVSEVVPDEKHDSIKGEVAKRTVVDFCKGPGW